MTNMFKGVENDKPVDDEPMDVQDSVQPVYTGPILENMLTGDTQTEGKTAQEIIDEDACRAEANFQFTLKNISKFKDQTLSPPCIVRNLPWKMLLMHRNSQAQDRAPLKTLGFFLQCNGESNSTSWSCNASAKLKLKKQTGDGEDFVRGIAHLFFHKENDWGFSNFVPMADLFDPAKGWIKDDSIILEVDVCADAPHGVSWDSKKHTGYVGLKNQGATCYMNSLLQTLYFTNKLRKAVYQMPTETHDPGNNVALALQRVFFDLQTSDKPVGTKKLTKSFGWETLDSFMQHDVQELCRVLLDNMESKMKGTCVDGTIPELFKGTMLSYIKCKDVDYVSEREEPFYDIQLNIKEKKDVCESFADYCTVETLDGDNKYDAGPHGLQDAEKGVIFIELPPVLHLQLMRFQYDPMTDANIKINDRFEFQEEIDLTKYISKYPTEEGSKCIYRLHAVLVHSGDNHGGHYVGYIDPKGDGKWCKFDDDVVSRCTTKEAIDRNFGGHDDDISAKHSTNAYMLVYINTKKLDEVLHPISIEDIPESLQKKLEDERILEAQKRKEKNEAHLYTTINIFTDDVFFSHHGHDLFDNDKRPESIRPFKVKKADSINTFINMLSDAMKVEPHKLRLWPFQARQNGTYRPSLLDRPIDGNSKICDVVEMDSGVTSVDVFLERVQADGTLVEFDKNRDVCLFIKSYDPKTETLAFCGHQIYPISCSLKAMMPALSKLAGYPENTDLSMFEEVKPNMIEVIKCDDNMLLEKALDELMDGDIIIIQRKEQKENYRLPTPKDYSRELYYQVEVTFLDKNTTEDQGFTLILSLKDNYEKIATTVAEYLRIPPNMIQFFRHLGYKETSGAPIKCTFEGQLKELIPRGGNKTPKKLYYQKLSIPINELENKRQIKCCYIPHKSKEEKELTLHPNKNGTVGNLLEEAKSHLELNPAGSGKLRLLEVNGFKIVSIYDHETALDSLAVSNGKSLRIEEIPSEEESLAEFCRLVPVAHFHQETYSAFGVPFLIIVKDGERFSDLKDRIRKKIDVTDKEFEKYKLCVVAMGRKTYIDDDIQLINIDNFKQIGSIPTRPWIGLDHVNKAPKRNRPPYMEKAIKIHN